MHDPLLAVSCHYIEIALMAALVRKRRLLAVRGAVPLSSDKRNLFRIPYQRRLVLSSAISGDSRIICFAKLTTSLPGLVGYFIQVLESNRHPEFSIYYKKIGLIKPIGMDASPRMWMGQLISIPKFSLFCPCICLSASRWARGHGPAPKSSIFRGGYR